MMSPSQAEGFKACDFVTSQNVLQYRMYVLTIS